MWHTAWKVEEWVMGSHPGYFLFLLFYHNMVFLVSKLVSDSQICLPQVELEPCTATAGFQKTKF